jgi:hypothetical protein
MKIESGAQNESPIEREGWPEDYCEDQSLQAVRICRLRLTKWLGQSQRRFKNPFEGGRRVGIVGFSQEAPVPMETAFGDGLDGRMYTDLSRLDTTKI